MVEGGSWCEADLKYSWTTRGEPTVDAGRRERWRGVLRHIPIHTAAHYAETPVRPLRDYYGTACLV